MKKENTTTKYTPEHIFFRKILYDIRNFTTLTPEKIEFIKTLSHEQKMEIINEYDKMLDFFSSTI